MFWKKDKNLDIIVPGKGELIPIEDVQDQVFSQKMMGEGFAFMPEEEIFLSPIDGEIVTIFRTGHAYGVVNAQQVEVLVHIGIDTVELDGKGFNILKSVGDYVKKGDEIIRVDLDFVRNAGYSLVTPVVFTNKDKSYEIGFPNGNLEVKVK